MNFLPIFVFTFWRYLIYNLNISILLFSLCLGHISKFKSFLLAYGVELTYPEFEKSWNEMTAEEKLNKSILDARNVPIIP